jgi:hypothetical protein
VISHFVMGRFVMGRFVCESPEVDGSGSKGCSAAGSALAAAPPPGSAFWAAPAPPPGKAASPLHPLLASSHRPWPGPGSGSHMRAA